MIPDLKGVDPNDAFCIVPYEKGFTLLFYLETLLGGPGKSWDIYSAKYIFLKSCIYTKKHVLPFNGQFCFVEWGRKYE